MPAGIALLRQRGQSGRAGAKLPGKAASDAGRTNDAALAAVNPSCQPDLFVSKFDTPAANLSNAGSGETDCFYFDQQFGATNVCLQDNHIGRLALYATKRFRHKGCITGVTHEYLVAQLV